ncbi:MAG TPA: chemotaxis protein CheA [Longimicrobiaceae bacterium]|nr:chemotaxis protein CheA [Longimicrobiaceae bacterium]
MKRTDYSDIFLTESREHVSVINEALLALEAEPDNSTAIASVFRAVHTIKGMAAAMRYTGVAELAHAMEQLLDPIRSGDQKIEDDTLQLLFSATDGVERGVEVAADDGEPLDASAIIRRLNAAAALGASATDSLNVVIRLDAAAPLPGVRAFLALREARELGTVMGVHPSEDRLGDDDFQGTISFWLDSTVSPEIIRERLLAVGDVIDVSVEAAGPEVGVEEMGTGGSPALRRGRFIRVDLNRLDRLVNQMGELVLVRDRLRREVGPSANPGLEEAVALAARLISEMRNEVMRVRMVPAGQVFDRFPRLVRDAARALGKAVDFIVQGSEIELDRTLLDEIGDPLVHLLRNAVDHGIETPAERNAAGKPELGTLRLEVEREGSGAVIRVSDDGRGISRDGVLEAAVARGLISPSTAAHLSDEEVFRLLTRAGFTTSARVTDVSGRGVGLDVVANRVRLLGGSLDISSQPGRGTAFEVRLPLTLAILRAMLIRCDGVVYALPLAYVSETAEVSAADIRAAGAGEVFLLRGEPIPLIRLHSLLGVEAPPRGTNVVAVVLELGDQCIALEIDDFTGQQEIVVKEFDSTVDTLRIFSGATILADGSPALILDADSVFSMAAGAAFPHS